MSGKSSTFATDFASNKHKIMKKVVLLLALCLMGMGVKAQQSLPQWAQDLVTQNPGVIDSVRMIPVNVDSLEEWLMSMSDLVTRSYLVYYHQPRKHSEPSGEQFPLRAVIIVYNDANPTTATNVLTIGGYSLSSGLAEMPDIFVAKDDKSALFEIAGRYHGNCIMPEYRYFQYSSPVRCYEKLEDLRSEEAAEDFHNLIEALKKVLKGKWAVTGGSKGGTATLAQHAFHPEDADIFVPYVAPFFNTTKDTAMAHYWYNNGWNKEYLDMFMNMRKTMLFRMDTIYPIYYQLIKTEEITDNEVYGSYLANTALFGYEEHVSQDTAFIRKTIAYNSSVMNTYNVKEYNDTVYAIMLKNDMFQLKYFGDNLTWLRDSVNNQAPSCPRGMRRVGRSPRSVPESEWWGGGVIGKSEKAYEYQAKTELGYYDFRLDQIVGQEVGPAWNAVYKQYVGNMMDFTSPCFKDFPFDPSLYNRMMTTTQSATKPIVFIYGEDDCWTGAAIKDEFVNGTNVKKFILPAQNHYATFSANTDMAKSNAIRAILDGVFGDPQGIESFSAEPVKRGEKIFRDGQLLIIRDGRTYNVLGTEIK